MNTAIIRKSWRLAAHIAQRLSEEDFWQKTVERVFVPIAGTLCAAAVIARVAGVIPSNPHPLVILNPPQLTQGN